jgi:hypothetical protein
MRDRSDLESCILDFVDEQLRLEAGTYDEKPKQNGSTIITDTRDNELK